MKKLVILFLLSYAATGGAADAATYHVSKSGSNSNSCAQALSTSTPKLTIAGGLECIVAGDTLLIQGGTYDEGLSRAPSGTSWANKVRIAASPGETVWMTPLVQRVNNPGWVILFQAFEHYIEFDGINMDCRNTSGCIDLVSNPTQDPHHIRIQNAQIIGRQTDNSAYSAYGQFPINAGGHGRGGNNDPGHTIIGGNEFINLTISGGGRPGDVYEDNGYGIYVSGPNNLVEGCDIYDNKGAGIHVYNGEGDPASNNIIRNNRIHDLRTADGVSGQTWGILLAGDNNQVYNNAIYRITALSTGAGVFVYYGDNNQIYNNTIYNTNYGLQIHAGASNTKAKNNILYAASVSDYVNGGTGTSADHNLISTNPLFVDASTNRFQLQASSPAVDTGTSISTVTTDYAGMARPQGSAPDIGAYEYGTAIAPDVALAAPSGLRILAN